MGHIVDAYESAPSAVVNAMAESGPSPDSAALLAGMRLEVEVVRHDGAWDDVAEQMLARAARAALAEAPALPAGDYEMTILLTGDEEMRALNRTWRGKDAPTNVLSFPASESLSGPGCSATSRSLARRSATKQRERDLALADHVSHLVVHGVLHLLGFDHATRCGSRAHGGDRAQSAGLAWHRRPICGSAARLGAIVVSNTDRIAENDFRPRSSDRPMRRRRGSSGCLQSFGLGEEPDLRELIEDALARSKSDTLNAQERSMLRRILHFGKLLVEDVMVPRADIIAVDEKHHGGRVDAKCSARPSTRGCRSITSRSTIRAA